MILNEKIDFLRSKKFKLFSQINRNSIGKCDFLIMFVMSVRGDDCGDYLPLSPKTLATSLLVSGISCQFSEEEVNLKFQRVQELEAHKIHGCYKT